MPVRADFRLLYYDVDYDDELIGVEFSRDRRTLAGFEVESLGAFVSPKGTVQK